MDSVNAAEQRVQDASDGLVMERILVIFHTAMAASEEEEGCRHQQHPRDEQQHHPALLAHIVGCDEPHRLHCGACSSVSDRNISSSDFFTGETLTTSPPAAQIFSITARCPRAGTLHRVMPSCRCMPPAGIDAPVARANISNSSFDSINSLTRPIR